MKKASSVLAFLVISVLFFYACNTGDKGQEYIIKMRLNKGDTFRQDMQVNMLMNTFGRKMNMTIDMGCSFMVENNDSINKQLKLTYTNAHTSMDMGGNGMKNMSDSILNRSNNNIVGKTISIQLSKDNEITNVVGLEEILNSQAHDSASKELMKKMFSKDQFNSMFGMMFNMYPKKPVKVGDSWNGDSKINMAGMDMIIANKYTLLSVRNGLAEIDINGTIKGGGEMMKETRGMKMDMSGTQKGTITIRMDNGYLHSGSYKTDIKAEMEMMGQKIPMTMLANYKMKGI
jgi:hypothetical protein